MKTLVEQQRGTLRLRAPSSGAVHWCAPRVLCGELEIYESGELIADVGGIPVVAPGRGFIVRAAVPEGCSVEIDREIAMFGIA